MPSWRTVISYGLPTMPVNFIYTLVLVMFVKFATDVLLVESVAAIGLVFLFARVWDAVSDPVVGFVSDRGLWRIGRRKACLLVASVPMGAFTAMLWAPPPDVSGGALTAWIAVAVVGFYTAFTLFEVPHTALGAEMTHHQARRNRVFGTRHAMRTVGMFGAFLIGAQLLENPDTARDAARALGIGAGVLCSVTILWALWALPPEREEFRERGPENPLRAMRDVLANPHARLALVVFFIESIGTGGIGVLAPFVIEYVVLRPDLIAEILVIVPSTALAFVPVWLWLARHFERHRLWLVSMILSGIGFGLLLFLDESRWWLLLISAALAGVGTACANTLGYALKADIIDYDEYVSGERKEGTYYAAWTFTSKLAAGLVIGVVGVALEWMEFRPNEVQTAEVRQWLLILIAGIPAVFYTIGVVIFWFFRLDRAEHARIMSALESRRAEAPESIGARDPA